MGSTQSRSYKGGYENVGKGTPQGDGKDKAMRRVAHRCVVELADDRPSSSLTTLSELGQYNGEAGFTVMLARNSRLRGNPLRDDTKQKLREAHANGCNRRRYAWSRFGIHYASG